MFARKISSNKVKGLHANILKGLNQSDLDGDGSSRNELPADIEAMINQALGS
jgi:hypothetical protein